MAPSTESLSSDIERPATHRGSSVSDAASRGETNAKPSARFDAAFALQSTRKERPRDIPPSLGRTVVGIRRRVSPLRIGCLGSLAI